MIEPHVSPSVPASADLGNARPRLPVRPATGRFLVLAGVFVCAACGLVYELELVALGSYLTGDSVTQASVVLSVMIFAMGLGSLLAKRLCRRAAVAFGVIEALLALVGGCSAMALYAVFAWSGGRTGGWTGGGTGGWGGAWADGPCCVLVAISFTIGLLLGAEIPLLMELIQRIRRQDAGGAVADLFAADYVGALAGGLAFPFLLLPLLGQLTGALVTGAVNAVAGAVLVLGLFRGDLTRRARRLLILANAVVLGLLVTATVLADDFERAARQAVYGPDVRVTVRSGGQEVVLTGGRDEPPDLYVGGRLRVGGRDGPGYHRALVRPAMHGPHARVLVLGGGDGLAVHEVLRQPGVRRVDVVELDAAVVRLARSDPALAALNGHAYGDPRVRVVIGDAFRLLRAPHRAYDVVLSDLPDPRSTAATKLYSQEFYGLLRGALAPGGRIAVHAGSVRADPQMYWTVDATLRAAGLRTVPYRAGRGEWGFVLASRTGPRPVAAGVRAVVRTRPAAGPPPSTLVHPRYGG